MKGIIHAFFLLMVMIACALVSQAQEAQSGASSSTMKLSIPGSSLYATPADVPVRSAVLLLDSLNFDGKSGAVRLHKGQTTMYLVISDLDIGCETTNVYDRKLFLQHNGPKLSPTIPELNDQKDWIAVLSYQQNYDPRKVSGPPLSMAISGTPKMDDFFELIPGGSKPKDMRVILSGRKPSALHFSSLNMSIFSKELPRESKPIRQTESGSWAYDLKNDAMFFDIKHHDPPFDPGRLTLRRQGNVWIAEINVDSKLFSLAGSLPVKSCPVNVADIN